jgi:hypothetical protein
VTTSSVSPYLQRPVRKLQDVISELRPLGRSTGAEHADSEAVDDSPAAQSGKEPAEPSR